MEYSVKMNQSEQAFILPHGVIVYANDLQFGPDEQASHAHVLSRMLLWCKQGRGIVRINDVLYPLEPGHFLFLPWGHAIHYYADPADPFFLAGVHLIPNHAPGRALEFDVAHCHGHALDVPWRRDKALPGIEGVIEGSMEWSDGLAPLVSYIVHLFKRGDFQPWQMRQLAGLFVTELLEAVQTRRVASRPIPHALRQLLRFISDHTHRPLGLDDLAHFSGMSRSSVGRMFKRYLNCTPGEWVLDERMRRACHLLRTTRLPVSEIGQRVGIEDPFYFSKLFKKAQGVAPLGYRKQAEYL